MVRFDHDFRFRDSFILFVVDWARRVVSFAVNTLRRSFSQFIALCCWVRLRALDTIIYTVTIFLCVSVSLAPLALYDLSFFCRAVQF